jgi:hypothetical protein
LFGEFEILRAQRQPCPVCGHPTGDCTDENIVKPDHIIGENFQSTSLKDQKMILVEEDIYENRQITPYTTTRVLIHRKGSYVTLDRARELGISKN